MAGCSLMKAGLYLSRKANTRVQGDFIFSTVAAVSFHHRVTEAQLGTKYRRRGIQPQSEGQPPLCGLTKQFYSWESAQSRCCTDPIICWRLIDDAMDTSQTRVL